MKFVGKTVSRKSSPGQTLTKRVQLCVMPTPSAFFLSFHNLSYLHTLYPVVLFESSVLRVVLPVIYDQGV